MSTVHPLVVPPARALNDDDPCPCCQRGDRIVFIAEFFEWGCTRCGTHWCADPNDPRLPADARAR
jgi:hypothetical protein